MSSPPPGSVMEDPMYASIRSLPGDLGGRVLSGLTRMHMAQSLNQLKIESKRAARSILEACSTLGDDFREHCRDTYRKRESWLAANPWVVPVVERVAHLGGKKRKSSKIKGDACRQVGTKEVSRV